MDVSIKNSNEIVLDWIWFKPKTYITIYSAIYIGIYTYIYSG